MPGCLFRPALNTKEYLKMSSKIAANLSRNWCLLQSYTGWPTTLLTHLLLEQFMCILPRSPVLLVDSSLINPPN